MERIAARPMRIHLLCATRLEIARIMPSFPLSALEEPRLRSVGLIESDGLPWACYLMTYRVAAHRWKGRFSFRLRDGDAASEEVRTAEIFVEPSAEAIEARVQQMGRPLLAGLLDSALETRRNQVRENPVLQAALSKTVCEHADKVESASALRSRYDTYCLDQIAHLVSLIPADDFRAAVENLLDGQRFEFGAEDQLQFALLVVKRLESLLPLPPLELWAEDYRANPAAYEDHHLELRAQRMTE